MGVGATGEVHRAARCRRKGAAVAPAALQPEGSADNLNRPGVVERDGVAGKPGFAAAGLAEQTGVIDRRDAAEVVGEVRLPLHFQRRAREVVDHRAAAEAVAVEEDRATGNGQNARVFENAVHREILVIPPTDRAGGACGQKGLPGIQHGAAAPNKGSIESEGGRAPQNAPLQQVDTPRRHA